MKKTKRWIGLLTALVLTLGVFPFGALSGSGLPTARAAEIVASGSFGDHFSYTYDDEGTITFSGDGAVDISISWEEVGSCLITAKTILPGYGNYEFWPDGSFYYGCFEDEEGNVDGEEFIAFYHCLCKAKTLIIENNLRQVSLWDTENDQIPIERVVDNTDSLETIKMAGLRKLSSVSLKNSITEIPDKGFMYCYALENIDIPDSVIKIGQGAFSSCSKLNSIQIPDSVTKIGQGAFSSCSKLNSIKLPNHISEISPAMFGDCKSLKSITLPDSIKNIDEQAFYNCSSLESIYIGKNVKNIGDRAFSDCDNLKDVYYAGSERDWNNILILLHNNALTNATIHFAESDPTGPDEKPTDPAADPTNPVQPQTGVTIEEARNEVKSIVVRAIDLFFDVISFLMRIFGLR